QFMASFDSKYGGFGNKPKFPSPHNFSLLLRSYQRDKKDATLKMVEKSLKEMRKGGIYDQVGFGFHRYSTDEHWLLPHFEKMLYDQAMLIIAYTEAYQVTEDPFYKEVVEEIIEYIKRDMTSPEGGFYSAEDADSDGVEGKFYVWTREEIIEILGKEDGEFYAKVYNIEAKGNFTDEATGHKTKDNIPHLKAQFFELASAYKMKRPDFKDKVYTLRKKLFLVRERRIHPLKDDKILTDWNGLMITALAKAGAALQNEDYIEMAEKAADFVLKTLRNKKGRLLKRYRKGKAGLTAHLEDYAFVTWGLIELYQASFKSKYLKDAVSLTDIMIKHFYDNKKGGFFMTADDSEKLFIRSKEIYDGAIPSGNSVACLTLQQLSQLTGNPVYLKFSEGILKAFSKEVERYPRGFSQLMIGLDYATGPSYEIVISGDPEKDDTKAMIKAIQKKFIPGKVIILRPAEDNKEIIALAPYLKDQKMKDKKATAYVCQNFACKQPVTSVKELLKNLGRE
ncbi:MAG: thioredoxin domain-containing protein, partial [Lentisphaeria bacterium]|nr:thioredoxin domain-containing protein [Lentisphaeria bacterium]NQZ70536.1 thioredoxin domain-containing protein [Lentisphaeria bacterium]